MATIMLMISLISMFLIHPMSLGLMLLLQTITISFKTSFLYSSFWFSYILLLIMIGGMLILFIYMTSIASNEKFKFKLKLTLPLIFTFFSLNIIEFHDYSQTFFSMNNIPLSKFINYPFNTILIFMILYLLLTLIVVVNVTNLKMGPLRQKF